MSVSILFPKIYKAIEMGIITRPTITIDLFIPIWWRTLTTCISINAENIMVAAIIPVLGPPGFKSPVTPSNIIGVLIKKIMPNWMKNEEKTHFVFVLISALVIANPILKTRTPTSNNTPITINGIYGIIELRGIWRNICII